MAMTIHIEPDSQPIAGWLQQEGVGRREFEGMIELIQLLERARTRAAGTPDDEEQRDDRPRTG